MPFLEQLPQHMEVPRLGVDRSYSSRPTPQPQQRQILNPLSEARARTHNLMVPSRIRFCCATMGTSLGIIFFLFKKLFSEFYYIYSCTTIITNQFYSISTPNPQSFPRPPNLSHLETVRFSKSVSQCLFCKEVHCVLFLDSTYKS